METTIRNIGIFQDVAVHIAISILVLAIPVMGVVEMCKSFVRTVFFRIVFRKWWGERSKSAAESFRDDRQNLIEFNWTRLGEPNGELRGALTEARNIIVDQYVDFRQHSNWWASVPIFAAAIPYFADDSFEFEGFQKLGNTAWREGLQACKLPRDLFMKKIENIAQTVVEQSIRRPVDFITFTDKALPADQHLAITTNLIEQRRPILLSSLQIKEDRSERGELHPAVMAAQNQVANAVERNLDDLQLRLERLWPSTIRTFAAVVGIIMSLFGGWWIAGMSPDPGANFLARFAGLNPGFSIVMLVIGLGAGVFASVVHDFAKCFTRIGRP